MEVGYKDLSKIAKKYRDLAQYYLENKNKQRDENRNDVR